ncbi:hypothetical protein HispidOSU_001620, partial [Sigmodon hispidus]
PTVSGPEVVLCILKPCALSSLNSGTPKQHYGCTSHFITSKQRLDATFHEFESSVCNDFLKAT